MNITQLSWKKIDLLSPTNQEWYRDIQIKKRMLKNVCRFMDIIKDDLACYFSYNSTVQHVLFQIWLPKIYTLCRSSRSLLQWPYHWLLYSFKVTVVSLTLHNHYSPIVVCVLHQVFYLCYQEVNRKWNRRICLISCKEEKLCT